MVIRIFLFFVFPVLFSNQAFAKKYQIKTLDSGAVCEVSASAVVPCGAGGGSCLLVADRKQAKKLYLYRIQGRKRTLVFRRALAFDHLLPHLVNETVSDIQGLARFNRRGFFAYGSYGRGERCEILDDRRTYFRGSVGRKRIAGTDMIAQQLIALEHNCDQLFGFDVWEEDAFLKKICAVIDRTEKAAQLARYKGAEDEQRRACFADPAFGIGGAVRVRDQSGSYRVWVGLRSPLVDGKAVFLRQIAGERLWLFDAAALVDLQGQGIRGLSVSGNRVWGLSGSVVDDQAAVRLWSFSSYQLKHGSVFKATRRHDDLPSRSSALALYRGEAVIMVRGRSGGGVDDKSCEAPTGYFFVKTK